ncbi:MAG TPA: adenylate/guanylate cyclase domain-containing protein [Sneathiellales bacterium]|nr:adenylate/guanylate cyclase domain-containing protein [Sneathiellales bacterium]
MEGDFPRDELEGFIVLVGTSAAGLKDSWATQLAAATPGVEIHAQGLEQILLGEYLVRPDWASGAEFTYLTVLGLLLIMLLSRVGPLPSAAIGIGGAAAAFGLSWYAFTQFRWLLDPVYPTMIAFIIYSTVTLLNYLRTETEKRFVRDAFGHYLSPALVERLSAHPEELVLHGETRNMTMLFCDIRGFTTLSEQFDAEGLTRFINSFLTPMTTVILELGGTVDKYMGDCIMAFWNAPLDDQDHARHACDAALAMEYVLTELNATWASDNVFPGPSPKSVAVGIGINSGDCNVGNMGSDQRFDYSVLGDDVNLASRLEGQSKVYGVPIIVGENTVAVISDFALLELDLVRVRGKTKPVRIFALLGDVTVAEDPDFKILLDRHNELLAAYREQDWDRAKILVSNCHAADDVRLSSLYSLYDERIRQYTSVPPGPDWDGVHTAPTRSIGSRYYQVGDGATIWIIKQLVFSKTDSIHHAIIEKSDASDETEDIPLYVLENPSNYRPDRRIVDKNDSANKRRRSTDTVH